MKIVAIVGAGSMVGRKLRDVLIAQGVGVITVGRSNSNDINIDLSTGGWTNPNENIQVDNIFHCAACFESDNPEGVRKNHLINAYGCHSILELSEQLKCRSIVYVGSTSSIKGSDSNGLSSYGLTKALGEEVLQWGMSRVSGAFTSLRFSQIYDTEGLCCRHQPWFGRLIAYASRGLDINIPVSEGVRNFINLDDAVDLLISAANISPNDILNVTHPQSMTYEEIANIAYSVFGMGGKVRVDVSKPPFREMNFPDSSITFDRLGKSGLISVSEGITLIKKKGRHSQFGPLDIS